MQLGQFRRFLHFDEEDRCRAGKMVEPIGAHLKGFLPYSQFMQEGKNLLFAVALAQLPGEMGYGGDFYVGETKLLLEHVPNLRDLEAVGIR